LRDVVQKQRQPHVRGTLFNVTQQVVLRISEIIWRSDNKSGGAGVRRQVGQFRTFDVGCIGDTNKNWDTLRDDAARDVDNLLPQAMTQTGGFTRGAEDENAANTPADDVLDESFEPRGVQRIRTGKRCHKRRNDAGEPSIATTVRHRHSGLGPKELCPPLHILPDIAIFKTLVVILKYSLRNLIQPEGQTNWCNPVGAKLQRSESVLAVTLTTSNLESAALAAPLGLDFLWLEMEHSPITLESLRSLVLARRGLPAATSSWPDAGSYYDSADANIMTVIEEARAEDCIDEIAATPGVDVLFIGTSDLSFSLGLRGRQDEPKLQDAIAKIVEAGQRHKKFLGRRFINPS